MVPSVRSKSFAIEIWMMLILMMILMMMLMMIMMMLLMMIMMTKPCDDDTDDDNDHKNDSYTAVGAAPGASIPCSLFLALWSRPFGPGLGYSIAAGNSLAAGYSRRPTPRCRITG